MSAPKHHKTPFGDSSCSAARSSKRDDAPVSAYISNRAEATMAVAELSFPLSVAETGASKSAGGTPSLGRLSSKYLKSIPTEASRPKDTGRSQ